MAEGPLPFVLTVFDKSFARKGTVGNPHSLEAFIRRNAAGSCVFTMDADHARTSDLMTPGARVVVGYRYDEAVAPMTLLSGRVSLRGGTGGTSKPIRTIEVVDDFNMLTEVLGWPVPTAALTAQTAEYQTLTGPAETVLKNVVSANATRLALPITVPATSGRGTSMTLQFRMHPLTDRLLPAIDQAGIIVDLVQSGSSISLQVRTPTIYARPLTELSGVVASGEFKITPPTVTRVVVGAGGEGTARIFRQVVDSARETAIGTKIERFVDARDISTTDANRDALMDARAQEALAEGAEKAALKVELSETTSFRFGKTFGLGDIVTVQLSGAPAITDAVREVAFSWTKDQGVVVTPRVGEWNDDTSTRIIQAVAKALKGVRKLEAR